MIDTIQDIQLLEKFLWVKIEKVTSHPEVLIVTATGNFIPYYEFRKAFTHLETFVEQLHTKKLIFDKRKLKVFHQPSMEWYFLEWKSRVYKLGLDTHRKILPKDDAFKQSVQTGIAKIHREHQDGIYKKLDIAYVDNLQDAIMT